jgi:hypothetical protein
MKIPKNQVWAAMIWALHYDSEFYPNPEIFDPERYFLALSPLIYYIFRSCINIKKIFIKLHPSLIKVYKFSEHFQYVNRDNVSVFYIKNKSRVNREIIE